MALQPSFPTDPCVILDPDIRWRPGDDQQGEMFTDDGYARLIPPLVYRIRKGVKAWRDKGYPGASDTTKALLRHWFDGIHVLPQYDGNREFQYYFAQREAVETAIWLYEVEKARDPYSLIRYDASGRVSKGMFAEDWTRYVMKLATGAGKTKVMSLLIAWAYFHKRYEDGSDLSTNFLVIAPNIIVLDRLRSDFDGLKIFHHDPVLPANGYEGRDWKNDFQITLHVQDEVRAFRGSDTGNIFLTNIHRVYERDDEASFEDDNLLDYFAGPRPTGATNESQVDLDQIIREVPDLVVINDEAHHIHDPSLAWFRNIQDISNKLRQKGSKLSAQFDLTATPKHNNGAIFVQTVSDYPLVEAVRQGVVKTPVLPDEASRAKLQVRKSSKFTEQYEDYLRLGYLEWKKRFDELKPSGKKSVLFVMTENTKTSDEVGEYLEDNFEDLRGAVLVIHTNNKGEISESTSSKRSKEELEKLRDESERIDGWESPYKAVVSVMMLREGWDVQNVVAMVGLRPYGSESQILPEQTLGRGLRLMYRGWAGPDGLPIRERVSVVGTDPFMDFVESIKHEGVELDYAPMGEKSQPTSPVVVEVERDNEKKDIDALDIEMPVLTPRISREYKNLEALDVASLPAGGLKLRDFSEEEQRQIVFKDIDRDVTSHETTLDSTIAPTSQSAVGFFARSIMRQLRLVGGFDILFGKMKQYMRDRLFDREVDLDDLNVLRNLSEAGPSKKVFDVFRKAVNDLTVSDKGSTQIRDRIKLSNIRPYVANERKYIVPKRSMFNKVITDNEFELDLAAFLDKCDIVSFMRNPARQPGAFSIEYRTADGGIAPYYPDFIVKEKADLVWVIEGKGREDLDDVQKWERLKQWCKDATERDGKVQFRPMLVRQEDWDRHTPRDFADLVAAFYKA